MASLINLIKPSCGLSDLDRAVPLNPNDSEYVKNVKEVEKQRGEIINCGYLKVSIGCVIVFIIVLIGLFLQKNMTFTSKAVIMILLGAAFGGFIFASRLLFSRNYDVEQTIFNGIYEDSGWDLKKTRDIYEQRKQAELDRESRMSAASMH